MLRDERAFRSNHRESDKTAAPAVRRISAKRTRASFGRARSRLGSVTRLSVEKFPVFFLLFTGRPIFYRCSCMHAPGLKKPVRKSGRFWRNEPDSHPSRIHADLAERTQELAEGQRAGRTSLSRDSARIVISAIVEGLRHNDFRHFPQTKPISANEANTEKVNETMLQDEQHAPLRSGARTRLLCACSGAAGSAFCQPVQIDDEGSL